MARSSVPAAARAAVRLLVASLASLALLLTPTLVFAALFSWWRDSPDLVSNLSLGLVCSLIAWQFVAAFHLTRERLVVSVPDRKAFLPQVRVLLEEMGYEVTAQTDDNLVTRPRFNALLFGGGLRVTVQGQQATIVGPKLSAEMLRNRLRLAHHLFRVQGVLAEERRATEPLLKRVEICLRVTPGQLAEIQERVLGPLLKAGEVVLEVNVLVQSEQGVRESTIEQQVRPWARSRAIPCDIHKHHAQLFEPHRLGEHKALV